MTLESAVQQGIFERIGSYISEALRRAPPQDSSGNNPSNKLPNQGPFRTSPGDYQINTPETTDFYVEKDEKYYWLYNVPHLGEKKTFGLTKQPLDNGDQKTLDGWITHLSGKDDCLLTSDEFFSIANCLENNKNIAQYSQRGVVEEVRNYLRQELTGQTFIMGTKAVYFPNVRGKIIQNVGRETEQEMSVSNLRGQCSPLKHPYMSSAVISAVCGTDNADKICENITGLTGREPYVSRYIYGNDSNEHVVPVALGREFPDSGKFSVILGCRKTGRAFGISRQAKISASE